MHDFYVTYVHKTPCGIVLSSCSTRESLTCTQLLSSRLRSRLSTINVSASSTSLNKEISRKLPWSQEFLKTQRLELSGARWSPAASPIRSNLSHGDTEYFQIYTSRSLRPSRCRSVRISSCSEIVPDPSAPAVFVDEGTW